MAKDSLELHLYGMEEDGEQTPEPTQPDQVSAKSPSFITLVEVWMPLVRDEMAEALKKRLEARNRPRDAMKYHRDH